MHHPQQDRRAHDRLPGIPVAENNGVRSIGKEAERGKNNHQIRDVGDHRAQPVAPGGAKTDKFTETFAGIGEDTAVKIGANAGQQQHGEGEE